MSKKTAKPAKKVAAPKKEAKAIVKPVAVKAPIVEKKDEVTFKEKVADFLTGKSFQNSRVAYRQFKKENPSLKIKQTYFYTLFVTFGTRAKKKDSAVTFISGGTYKNCMEAYKAFKKTVPEGEKPVVFAYFLNLWKRHFGLTGPIRQKAAIKAPKVEKVVEAKIVELSKMSAKEILAKTTELLKAKAKVMPTNVKNKTAIVRKATELFSAAGYVIA